MGHRPPPLPDLQMTPGTFFQTRDNRIWRLEARDEPRWKIRLYEDGELGAPQSVAANFSCTIVTEEYVHGIAIARLYERAFRTEAGSEHGRINENEMSGSWAKSSSVVTTRDRFEKTCCLRPETITAMIAMWGEEFVYKFFLELETLGGYYDAEWGDYTEPGRGEYGAPLSQCGFDDGEDGVYGVRERRQREPVPRVRGSAPDWRRYHDTSDPQTAVPLLRMLEDEYTLVKLKTWARRQVVKDAAEIVLQERRGATSTTRG